MARTRNQGHSTAVEATRCAERLSGRTLERVVDRIWLNVVAVGSPVGQGFAVEVHINEVEVTSKGAGLGMDPYDVLVPLNRLVAGCEPTVTPIARCRCGDYGCAATDVEVTADEEFVHWDWRRDAPMARRATFDRSQYSEEVARAGFDFSWETPERTAGRLVLQHMNAAALPFGIRVDWAANDRRMEDIFRVCLRDADQYQVFRDFPWSGRTPEQLAEAVVSFLLEEPVETWTASWHARHPGDSPPLYAGPSWARRRF